MPVTKPTDTWQGDRPTTCQVCKNPLKLVFYDAKTDYGPWAIMCERCFGLHGYGLGTGLGQKYDLSTGLKVGG